VLVLAVEGQQRAADVAQVGRRGAAPVEVRARPPLRAHAPGEHELLGVVGDAVAQLGADPVRQLERALHVRLRRTRTDDPGARLAAQQEVQRVREHGLPRPGLARQDVEPSTEPELGSLDEEEVLYAKLVEHA
jgi:hypothetical protein